MGSKLNWHMFDADIFGLVLTIQWEIGLPIIYCNCVKQEPVDIRKEAVAVSNESNSYSVSALGLRLLDSNPISAMGVSSSHNS